MKNATGKVKEFFGKMSTGVKIAIVLVLLAAVGVAVGLTIHRANKPYTVLFTGLSQDDLSSILTYFNENQIQDYKVERNDTILVPESQEVALKAAILQQGYPTSGYAYGTYLDNVGILSSERDRQQLTKYDLQDQLRAVIRRFDNVKDATPSPPTPATAISSATPTSPPRPRCWWRCSGGRSSQPSRLPRSATM